MCFLIFVTYDFIERKDAKREQAKCGVEERNKHPHVAQGLWEDAWRLLLDVVGRTLEAAHTKKRCAVAKVDEVGHTVSLLGEPVFNEVATLVLDAPHGEDDNEHGEHSDVKQEQTQRDVGRVLDAHQREQTEGKQQHRDSPHRVKVLPQRMLTVGDGARRGHDRSRSIGDQREARSERGK